MPLAEVQTAQPSAHTIFGSPRPPPLPFRSSTQRPRSQTCSPSPQGPLVGSGLRMGVRELPAAEAMMIGL